MKKYSAAGLALVLTAFLPLCATAETFRYKFLDGDSYRINSVVKETVLDNRILSYTTEITNRITVHISDVLAGDKKNPASAKYEYTYMSSERASDGNFPWGREYASSFRKDELGNDVVDAKDFMPMVRNVPVFPQNDIKAGETWTATGEEAHDLRDATGMQEPFRVPFTVNYTYVGPVEKNGKKLDLIHAEYTLFFDTPPKVPATASAKPPETKSTTEKKDGGATLSGDYPVSTMGYSKQDLYWDNELGLISFYAETFRIQLQLASGNVIEFRGTAEATVTETELIDRAKAVKDMNDQIAKMGIVDTKATSTDDGITISLENIQFEADSANLLPSEKEKITKIAAILERYPDKELLISGHTALAGTPATRQKLSEDRAEAVARFLVGMGVRSDYNVYTRGFGAEKPLVPNTSEQKRARNRRVEITILDK